MEGADESATRRYRAIKPGLVGMLAASLVLAGLLVPWKDLLSSGPPQPHVDPGGSLSWEAEGWVKSAAPSTNSIRVSSGFLGLSSLTLVVPLDTLIMVGGKEGGFDDLHEGRRVRAIYEARPSGLHTKSIEVLVDGVRSVGRASESPASLGLGGRPSPPVPPDTQHAGESPTPASKVTDTQTRASTAAPKPADTRNAPGVAAPAPKPADAQTGAHAAPRPADTRSAPVVPARAPKSTDTRGAKESVSRAIPSDAPLGPPTLGRAARDEPGRATRDESSMADRGPIAPSNALREGAPRSANAEPRRGQAADPGAVIDWLLKESSTSGQ